VEVLCLSYKLSNFYDIWFVNFNGESWPQHQDLPLIHIYTFQRTKSSNLSFARYYCQWPWASNNKIYGWLLSILGCQCPKSYVTCHVPSKESRHNIHVFYHGLFHRTFLFLLEKTNCQNYLSKCSCLGVLFCDIWTMINCFFSLASYPTYVILHFNYRSSFSGICSRLTEN